MKIYSIEQIQKANQSPVNFADYLHYALSQESLAVDIIIGLIKLSSPTIIKIDGCYLVEEVGAVDRYERLKDQGINKSDIQYWANLTNIREIFSILTFAEAQSIAVVIADCWNSIIQTISSGEKFSVISDENENEVFIANKLDK